ncbi:MAG TPA: molybdopterin cofactor-binding domain-containing protein [Thermoanaerobaculia bacterium]|jgi:isoquinoline 1-oxidoreductase beta subunit|nr:molybdopterin cofactor-binding domain-containing protein [Thermoanaerobaculia bacterium]
MSGIFKITRREFLRQTGVGAGALVLGYSMFPTEPLSAAGLPDLKDIVTYGFPLGAFVAIKPLSGHITIFTHRAEMGQGIKSSLAAVLADELEADWDRVTLHQADADAVNFGVPFPYPMPGAPAIVKGEDAQFTDSSRSMAAYFLAMRLFGAGIRLVMIRAAAAKWGVKATELEARQQKIYHKLTGRSIEYHHLLLEAKKVAEHPPETDEIKAVLKTPDQWRFIGKKTMPFVDARDMVTGKAVYGADVDVGRRDMLTAMIVRCPVANGTLKSFDKTAALAVPGVKFVEPVLPPGFPMTGGVGANFIPHAGVAVLAENTWAALQGRRVLKVEWDLGPNATYDSDAFRGELEASTSQPGKPVRWKGDVDGALGGAAKVVEAGYHIPHLAQAPMEPPVAIAHYENGQWEIWCPTQGPELAQHYVGLAMLEPEPLKWLIWLATELSELREGERETQQAFNESIAKLLNVDEPTLFKMRDDLKKRVRDKIKIHPTLLGGGFGRKSNPDYVMEAAFLARQHPGVPIRVQWTREDDIQFSFYNAASSQYLKAGLGADGRPAALLHRSALTSFFATIFPPPSPSASAVENDINAKARAAFHNGGEYLYGSCIERAQGLEDNPYAIDNLRIENSPAANHIRCGWMRSVANIYHAFGLCSFADEMAVAAGRDSKDYLLELIGQGRMFTEAVFKEEHVPAYDNNLFPINRTLVSIGGQEKEISPGYPPDTRRLRAVVERVAKDSGWDEKRGKLPKGRGLGIAAHRSFLSYVAIVVDVSLNEANELTINEIYAALDCGFVVNPDRVYAQMEGGIIYGLSYALLGEITVKNGAVVQNNFDNYPVLRIHQTPKKISTSFVVPSPEVVKDYPGGEVPLTGAGEPPTPAVAPALANAIVAAGGPRIREIPFYRKVVVR